MSQKLSRFALKVNNAKKYIILLYCLGSRGTYSQILLLILNKIEKFVLFLSHKLQVVLFGTPASGQTVGNLIAARSCSTAGMAGLSNQIARAVNCIKPGLLSDLRGTGVVMRSKDSLSWLQTEAIKGIKCAMQRYVVQT